MRIAVIGGGAAGFFAALSAKEHHPDAQVLLLEKSDKLLSKVRISGGGRCNVTHHCMEPRRLAMNYPRGGAFLKRAFGVFHVKDTIAWFAARGVQLKAEADGRMFPASNTSSTIVDCLMNDADHRGVKVMTHHGVRAILPRGDQGFELLSDRGGPVLADRLIVTTGGHPKAEGYAWLAELGHRIVEPVPSLFTFNMPDDPIRELQGVVAEDVRVRIPGTSLESVGPVLITHWGMSGPAVLKLSAWGARAAHERAYHFEVRITWTGARGEAAVREQLLVAHHEHGRRLSANSNVLALPKRLWTYLLQKAEIPLDKPWQEVAKKERNRLVDLITNDRYMVQGKTTFKEEFVTAGGVSLEEVDPITLQSKRVPGLYFAGEVLDVDGVTGGFNFQAAWTTGYLAGKLGH